MRWVRRRARGKRWALTAAGVVLATAAGLVVLMTTGASSRAQPTVAQRCHDIAVASGARHHAVTGSGPTVAVIGDSYSQGLGLADPRLSWPSRLAGRVVVDGFSGSGFSDAASPCPDEAYYHRVDRVLAVDPSLVVLQGGLNEYDVPDAQIRRGLVAALHELVGRHVVLVGPPMAPSRAYAVARVDALMARVAAGHDVPYVGTAGWTLSYASDHLHLTAAGHAAFGDAVQDALDTLGRVPVLR
jgi:acyl-CoA thioesterase-1